MGLLRLFSQHPPPSLTWRSVSGPKVTPMRVLAAGIDPSDRTDSSESGAFGSIAFATNRASGWLRLKGRKGAEGLQSVFPPSKSHSKGAQELRQVCRTWKDEARSFDSFGCLF